MIAIPNNSDVLDSIRECTDELKPLTGKTTEWWIAYVQRLITKYTYRHDEKMITMVPLLFAALTEEVCKHVVKKPEDYDENLRATAIMSLVLVAWHVRCRRSKCSDPRRVVKDRRSAYGALLEYQQALVSILIDVPLDANSFEQASRDTDALR